MLWASEFVQLFVGHYTSSSQTRSDQSGKTGKARGPVRRGAKEVMAELLEELTQKLDPQPPTAKTAEERQPGIPVPIAFWD